MRGRCTSWILGRGQFLVDPDRLDLLLGADVKDRFPSLEVVPAAEDLTFVPLELDEGPLVGPGDRELLLGDLVAENDEHLILLFRAADVAREATHAGEALGRWVQDRDRSLDPVDLAEVRLDLIVRIGRDENDGLAEFRVQRRGHSESPMMLLDLL